MAALCWCLSDNQQTQQTQLWTHCAKVGWSQSQLRITRCVSCQLTVKLHINTFTYKYIYIYIYLLSRLGAHSLNRELSLRCVSCYLKAKLLLFYCEEYFFIVVWTLNEYISYTSIIQCISRGICKTVIVKLKNKEFSSHPVDTVAL